MTKEEDYVSYDVTGVDVYGKRFKISTSDARHAAGINLWRGTKWGVKKDGTRKKLVEICN